MYTYIFTICGIFDILPKIVDENNDLGWKHYKTVVIYTDRDIGDATNRRQFTIIGIK